MQVIFDYIKYGGRVDELIIKGEDIIAPMVSDAHKVIREYLDYGVTTDIEGRRVAIYKDCAQSLLDYTEGEEFWNSKNEKKEDNE